MALIGIAPRPLCPQNQKRTQRLARSTLEALVREDLRPALQQSPYFFCADRSCEVIYVSVRADHLIHIGELDLPDPDLVCFCFKYSEGDLQQDIERNGQSTLYDLIEENVRQRLCSCEELNPAGVCCLGEVMKVISKIGSG